MEEIVFDGKKYISSKLAAKLTGYAKDYVGQLCRESRVTARLVGRSWYVLEDSIKEHRFGTENDSGKKTTNNSGRKQVEKKEKSDVYIKYIPEEITQIPIIEYPNLFRKTHKTPPIVTGSNINLNKKEVKQDLLKEQNTCKSEKDTNKMCENKLDNTVDNIAISRIEQTSKPRSGYRNIWSNSIVESDSDMCHVDNSTEKNKLTESAGADRHENKVFVHTVNLVFIVIAIIVSIIGVASMGIVL